MYSLLGCTNVPSNQPIQCLLMGLVLYLLMLVQVLGYVFVKALVCVPVKQHFQPVNLKIA